MTHLLMDNRTIENGEYEHFLKISRIEVGKENFSLLLMNHYKDLNMELPLKIKNMKRYYKVITRLIRTVISMDHSDSENAKNNFLLYIEPVKKLIVDCKNDQNLESKHKKLIYLLGVSEAIIESLSESYAECLNTFLQDLRLLTNESFILDA